MAEPAAAGAASRRWELEALPPSAHFLDYIPGRDTLFSAGTLAAGTSCICSASQSFGVCCCQDAGRCCKPLTFINEFSEQAQE